MVTLTLKNSTSLPLELTGIVPAVVAGKTLKQIAALSFWHGNREIPLGEQFSIKGASSDERLTFVGDLHAAVGIGAGMKSGSLRVEGPAGHGVGMQMWGGDIEVTDCVQDNLGAEMYGGVIRVQKSAGSNVGGALPGSQKGMTGGTILVEGDAGQFVGQRMRRGLIAIRGKAGDYLGHTMLAGSLIAGRCGVYPGTEMSRGTICVTDTERVECLPTFRLACTTHAPVVGMIGKQLHSLGFENDLWNANRRWRQFNGDLLVSGRGELFTAAC
jgi:formylmethanofuran dehydrogenase subunit C